MGWPESSRAELLGRLGLPAEPVDERTGSWVVRLSRGSADHELRSLGRLEGLEGVPRLLSAGTTG